MPSRSSRSSVIPILILVAAVALWALDMYRDVAPPAPKSGTSSSSPAQSPTSKEQPSAPSGRYEVFDGCTLADDKANDGDSFRVKLPGGRTEIIRLYFVDTPESAFKTYGGGENNHARINDQAADMGGITPQEAVEIGKKARDFTLTHLGKAPFTLHTEWDSPFNDKRYHGFVTVSYSGNPRLLHELLVEKGYARIHTKGAPLPDGTSQRKQEDHLRELQRSAKSSEAGAWGL